MRPVICLSLCNSTSLSRGRSKLARLAVERKKLTFKVDSSQSCRVRSLKPSLPLQFRLTGGVTLDKVPKQTPYCREYKGTYNTGAQL